jgi:NADPH-dependent 2,4-dienoyl-CoA reductase/sulfur reductase-like enzyme
VETLRREGYQGRLAMICAERHRPYDRPPLSKDVLLAAEETDEPPAFRPAAWYEEREIDLRTGVRASGLDPAGHRVTLDDGTSVPYETLVVATGARPRTLPLFARYANVSTLRTLDDSRLLHRLVSEQRTLAILGAGFIGQEVAAAARSAGSEVSVIELEPLPLGPLLGEEVGRWFAELHRGAGVELLLGREVSAVSGDEVLDALVLDDGTRVAADHLVIAIGVDPDVAWLESCGVCASGIVTGPGGRTELPDVLAAGDCAAVFDPLVGGHVVAGHWEAASRQGIQAARTILGEEATNAAPPSFWSDQYGTRINYLGHAALADRVTIDGDLPARDFVAEYTRDGALVAALAVGRPRAMAPLRDRLASSLGARESV